MDFFFAVFWAAVGALIAIALKLIFSIAGTAAGFAILAICVTVVLMVAKTVHAYLSIGE